MFLRPFKDFLIAGAVGVGIVLAVQTCTPTAHSAEYDAAWFSANPAARRDMLQRCRNDVGLGRRAICGNAERAETKAFEDRMGRSSGTTRGGGGGMYDSPIVRDALRRACMEPAGRRLAGSQCRGT